MNFQGDILVADSRSLVVSHRFLRWLNTKRTLASVLDAIEEAFRSVLPVESHFSLWKWDEIKKKTIRLLPRLQVNASNHLPIVLENMIEHQWEGQEDNIREAVTWITDDAIRMKLGCASVPQLLCIPTKTVEDWRFIFFATLAPNQSRYDFQQALVLLARHSIHAIERVLLSTERDLLKEISNIANNSADRDDFIQQVVYAMKSVFDASGCSILLYDKYKDRMVLKKHYTTGITDAQTGEMLTEVEYEEGEGCTGWIWKHRCPVRLFNACDKNEWLEIDPTGSLQVMTKSAEIHEAFPGAPRPFIGVPILLGPSGGGEPKVVGILRLHKQLPGIVFLPCEEQLLQDVCHVLAAAIERWDRTTEVNSEIELQTVLFKISEAMTAGDEPEIRDILDLIVHGALTLFHGYACFVLLKDAHEDILRLEREVGIPPGLLTAFTLPIGKGLCGQAALLRQTVVSPDVFKDDRYVKELEEVRSEICTPILFGEECLGVLDVASNNKNFFRPEDLRTIAKLETFAQQAAIAIHRAQVLKEREVLRHNLVRTTEMMTASSIASGLAHELKNGLASISLMASKLEGVPGIKLSSENLKRLEEIRSESGDLYTLSLRLLDLSRVGEPHKREVYLNEIFEERIKLLDELVREKQMKLATAFDSSLSRPAQGKGNTVWIDERQIQQVLTNLIINSVDASSRKQKIEVFTKLISHHKVSFGVRDFGAGISMEAKKRLFEMFFTTKKEGFGVGLYVVKHLVENNHGGTIDMESREGKGTCFTISLPKGSPR